jgi:hypothetical protein
VDLAEATLSGLMFVPGRKMIPCTPVVDLHGTMRLCGAQLHACPKL